MTTLDYAQLYETEYRRGRRLKRLAARILWLAMFLLRPNLALQVLAERRSISGW